MLLKVGFCHLLEFLAFSRCDRFLGYPQRFASARLHFDEYQRVAILEDEVDFAVGAAVVGLAKRVTLAFKVPAGHGFALLTEVTATVRQGSPGSGRWVTIRGPAQRSGGG